MNFFRRYIEYLKDNPEGYWFKRRLFGWGWVPATKQGWLVVFVYIIAILLLVLNIDDNSTDRELIFPFFLPFVLLTLILVIISYKKGQKPKWTWGFPKDNKESK